MQPLIWEHRPDGLRAPAMICAFTGWNDAGDAASSALSFLGSSLGATRFAQIDPEDYYDFQSVRPKVKLVEGETREIVWPAVEIFVARVPRAPRDLVLLGGPEPSMRWRTFTTLITDLAEALGVQMVVSLGALLADVPHSLPVHISGSASDPALTERLGLHPTGYEGPTGIVGVLHASCAGRGVPAAGPWGRFRSTAANWRRRRSTTSARSGSRCRAIPTSRRSSSASSSSPRTSAATPTRTSRRGTASPASSSASWASAATPATPSRPFAVRVGACAAPRTGACTRPSNGWPVISRRPGRRSGTRTSSRPRMTALARTPAP